MYPVFNYPLRERRLQPRPLTSAQIGHLRLAFVGAVCVAWVFQASVTWAPLRPVQGSLVVLTAPDASAGSLAGEPLHWEAAGAGGGYRALAAIPLTATDTVSGEVIINGATHALAIAILNRSVRSEKLRAADEFVRTPDSALEARLERERVEVRAVLEATHGRPRIWREAFVRPVPGRLLSGFGSTRTFNDKVQSRHRGADLAGAVGDTVRAANRGVVVIVAEHYYAGRSVWVDHGAGLLTVYLHLSAAAVAVGDTVARGQVVGRVGMTGRVTAPHLHWSALYGRVGFDPLELLGPKLGDLIAGTSGAGL